MVTAQEKRHHVRQESAMLITLIKIANKLDSLGEHELASELDAAMQDIIAYAGKTRKELEKDLEDIKDRLEDQDADLSIERIKELHEAKKNVEDDLNQLDEGDRDE